MASTAISTASVILSANIRDLQAGLQQAQQQIDSFVNQGNQKMAGIGKDALSKFDPQQAFGKIQSQLNALNFGTFFSKSMEKGALDFKSLDWGEIGAGIGVTMGGTIGAAVGGVLGSAITEHFTRVKALREEIAAAIPVANITGFRATDIVALQRASGIPDVSRILAKFNQARAEALTGNVEMRRAFEELGVAPEQAIENIEVLIQRFSALNRVQRDTIGRTLRLSGRGSESLVPFLGSGQAAIEQLREQQRLAGNDAAARERIARERAIADFQQERSNRGVVAGATGATWLRGLAGIMNPIQFLREEAQIAGRTQSHQQLMQATQQASAFNPQAERLAGITAEIRPMQDALEQRVELLGEELRLGRALTDTEKKLAELRSRGIPSELSAEVRALERGVIAETLLTFQSASNRRIAIMQEEARIGRQLTETEKAFFESTRGFEGANRPREALGRQLQSESVMQFINQMERANRNFGMTQNEVQVRDFESSLSGLGDEVIRVSSNIDALNDTLNQNTIVSITLTSTADGAMEAMQELIQADFPGRNMFEEALDNDIAKLVELLDQMDRVSRARETLTRNQALELTAAADPTIALRREMERINNLFSRGAINSATMTFAVNRALTQAEQALHIRDIPNPSAALRGSREAVESIIRHQQTDTNTNPQERLARILEAQREIAESHRDIDRAGFEDLRRLLRDGTGVI